jgi:hypothetical protein
LGRRVAGMERELGEVDEAPRRWAIASHRAELRRRRCEPCRARGPPCPPREHRGCAIAYDTAALRRYIPLAQLFLSAEDEAACDSIFPEQRPHAVLLRFLRRAAALRRYSSSAPATAPATPPLRRAPRRPGFPLVFTSRRGSGFYNTRVAGYMSGERGGKCACTAGLWEKLAVWLLVSSPGVMPHACILTVECFCHLAFAWVNERTQTSRVEIQLVGGCMADVSS